MARIFEIAANDEQVDSQLTVFKPLANEPRVRLLDALRDSEMCPCELQVVLDSLVENPDTAKGPLDELPDHDEVVTVCTEGAVSQTATDVLTGFGYDAVTLTDGMSGWSRVDQWAPVPVAIDGELTPVDHIERPPTLSNSC